MKVKRHVSKHQDVPPKFPPACLLVNRECQYHRSLQSLATQTIPTYNDSSTCTIKTPDYITAMHSETEISAAPQEGLYDELKYTVDKMKGLLTRLSSRNVNSSSSYEFECPQMRSEPSRQSSVQRPSGKTSPNTLNSIEVLVSSSLEKELSSTIKSGNLTDGQRSSMEVLMQKLLTNPNNADRKSIEALQWLLSRLAAARKQTSRSEFSSNGSFAEFGQCERDKRDLKQEGLSGRRIEFSDSSAATVATKDNSSNGNKYKTVEDKNTLPIASTSVNNSSQTNLKECESSPPDDYNPFTSNTNSQTSLDHNHKCPKRQDSVLNVGDLSVNQKSSQADLDPEMYLQELEDIVGNLDSFSIYAHNTSSHSAADATSLSNASNKTKFSISHHNITSMTSPRSDSGIYTTTTSGKFNTSETNPKNLNVDPNVTVATAREIIVNPPHSVTQKPGEMQEVKFNIDDKEDCLKCLSEIVYKLYSSAMLNAEVNMNNLDPNFRPKEVEISLTIPFKDLTTKLEGFCAATGTDQKSASSVIAEKELHKIAKATSTMVKRPVIAELVNQATQVYTRRHKNSKEVILVSFPNFKSKRNLEHQMEHIRGDSGTVTHIDLEDHDIRQTNPLNRHETIANPLIYSKTYPSKILRLNADECDELGDMYDENSAATMTVKISDKTRPIIDCQNQSFRKPKKRKVKLLRNFACQAAGATTTVEHGFNDAATNCKLKHSKKCADKSSNVRVYYMYHNNTVSELSYMVPEKDDNNSVNTNKNAVT